MPVTVVPTSSATVAIDTFMTELSRVMRNWPAASVISTMPAALAPFPASAFDANQPLFGHLPTVRDGLANGIIRRG